MPMKRKHCESEDSRWEFTQIISAFHHRHMRWSFSRINGPSSTPICAIHHSCISYYLLPTQCPPPSVSRLLELSKCVLSLRLFISFLPSGATTQADGRWSWERGHSAISLLSRYQFGLTLRSPASKADLLIPFIVQMITRGYFAGRAAGSGIYWRGNWRLCLPLWVGGEWDHVVVAPAGDTMHGGTCCSSGHTGRGVLAV